MSLSRRSRHCLGTADALKALQSRFTGRDRDLVVLGFGVTGFHTFGFKRQCEATMP